MSLRGSLNVCGTLFLSECLLIEKYQTYALKIRGVNKIDRGGIVVRVYKVVV